MRRIWTAVVLALIPVIALAFIFPERANPLSAIDSGFEAGDYTRADAVVFVRDGCPHCADLEEYFTEQEVNAAYLEIGDPVNQDLFKEVQKKVPTLQQGVPTIIIDGHVWQGFGKAEDDGPPLSNAIAACEDDCQTFPIFLARSGTVDLTMSEGTCDEDCSVDPDAYKVNVWGIGEVDLLTLSLTSLSLLLGFLDGFNPCAMWVLISLLTLLIATRDMKKILIVGGVFLLTSGVMYYFFIAAWLNVFLLIGLNVWVQTAIGLTAIGAGIFYLYEAFFKDPNVCHVQDMNARQRTIARMKNVINASQWPLMLGGVIVLAISVNMIELLCTAGLPAIFTQILAISDVSALARYWYMFLFIVMYMIDDTIIFLIAIFTMHATGMTTKYRRFTLIFGGMLMYVLGILLIFFPDLLIIG